MNREMGSIISVNLNLRQITKLILVSAIAIVPCGCSSLSMLMNGTSAIAQNATPSATPAATPSATPSPDPDSLSANACQEALQERVAQELGNQVQVAFDSTQTYAISNSDIGVRGTAIANSQNNSQAVNYRYDCTFNIANSQVSRITFNRISSDGTSTDLTSQQAYSRGYTQGQGDANNKRLYDPDKGIAEIGIQNNVELSRSYVQGYDVGYKAVTNATPNLTPGEAYSRGYQQGQEDANNKRQNDPVKGVQNNGIQNNTELSRSYTQGYGDGYRAVTNAATNLTSQEAYSRGYRQGQDDANNKRQSDPVKGVQNNGIQNNTELSRSYTQGYGDGYRSVTNAATNLTSQEAYNRGYRQGQNDANNKRQYDAVKGVRNNGIQSNTELSRSYTQGYSNGYKSVTSLPASPSVPASPSNVSTSSAIGQACTTQAQSQGMQVLAVRNIRQVEGGQAAEATLRVRRYGVNYTMICYRSNSGQISFSPVQTNPEPPAAGLW